MARVDHQEVVQRLKRALADAPAGKTSWGTRELRLLLQDLEVQCEVEESATDTLFRRFGTELEELFFDRLPGRSQTRDDAVHASDREPVAGPA